MGEWIAYAGMKRPVGPEVLVNIRCKEGQSDYEVKPKEAGKLSWDLERDMYACIVAYRIVIPEPPLPSSHLIDALMELKNDR